MVLPRLTTKLRVPLVTSDLVSRPRLLERMQGALSHSLVLISAPAGFGKTTLVSEWIRQNQPAVRAAWFSLEASENEPVRFWDYFMAALQTAHPKIGETALALLHSPQPVPTQTVLTTLLNECTRIAEHVIFVLDDYHCIQSPLIHQGLTFFLDHLPPAMHVVIVSRVDPPLPLARYRGRGTMLEIGVKDLRFTANEASDLPPKLGAPNLSLAEIEILNTKAEGWAVGLKMALLSLRGEQNVAGFIASFGGSQRYIMDYLIEEVLERQSQERRAFMLQTSVLERLSGPLCDHVTGNDNSRQTLLQMERENLFLVPLDSTREWYRYEHLFAELLRNRLELQMGREMVAELQRRASEWYEGNGFQGNAIDHALEARDWQRAARLMHIYNWIQLQRGEVLTTLSRCRLIPADVLHAHPEIYLQYGWALVGTGQLDEAEAVFNDLESSNQGDRRFQGQVAVGRTNLARTRGDTVRTREQAEKALALLPPDAVAPRGNISLLLGLDYYGRELFAEAEPLLQEACRCYQQSGTMRAAIMPLTLLGIISATRGDPQRALELYQQALKIDEKAPAAALTHLCLSAMHYQRNDLQEAALHLQRAVDLNSPAGGPELMDQTYLNLCRLRLAQGNEAGAAEALEKADELLPQIAGSPYVHARHAGFHILLSRAQGDSDAVSRWVEKLAQYPETMPVDIPFCARYLLFIRGSSYFSAERVQAAYDRFRETGVKQGLIMISLLRALVSPASVEALDYLAEALTTAKPAGLVRLFVDEGKLIAPLLRKAISRGIEPEFARQLLDAIESEERQREARNRETSAPSSSSVLSERELDVLKLMSAGLSNQEIARKLVIGLSTAKTHVHNILGKLYATDRLQAINRARNLKLIE